MQKGRKGAKKPLSIPPRTVKATGPKVWRFCGDDCRRCPAQASRGPVAVEDAGNEQYADARTCRRYSALSKRARARGGATEAVRLGEIVPMRVAVGAVSQGSLSSRFVASRRVRRSRKLDTGLVVGVRGGREREVETGKTRKKNEWMRPGGFSSRRGERREEVTEGRRSDKMGWNGMVGASQTVGSSTRGEKLGGRGYRAVSGQWTLEGTAKRADWRGCDESNTWGLG